MDIADEAERRKAEKAAGTLCLTPVSLNSPAHSETEQVQEHFDMTLGGSKGRRDTSDTDTCETDSAGQAGTGAQIPSPPRG